MARKERIPGEDAADFAHSWPEVKAKGHAAHVPETVRRFA